MGGSRGGRLDGDTAGLLKETGTEEKQRKRKKGGETFRKAEDVRVGGDFF